MAEGNVVLNKSVQAGTSHELELIDRVQRGENQLFYELVRPYERRVFAAAMAILRNESDAEDVAQESLVVAWERLAQFRGDSAFSTWLYRIVTRRALNRVQRRRAASSLDTLDDAPSHDQPALSVERQLTRDAVAHAILALPPAQRVVVVLHHLEGLSYAEVADITDSSEPAVRSHLFRARRTLGSTLADWK